MRRKTMRLVVMLAFVLLTVPLAAHAQPATKVYRIGSVRGQTASASASESVAFTQRLRELGYGLMMPVWRPTMNVSRSST